MSKKNGKPRTHEEAVARLERAAISAAVGKINTAFARMAGRVKVMETEAVGLVNDALQLGFFFQEATGRAQLEFFLFNGLDGLDERLDFRLAQAAVNLCARYGPKYRFQSMAEALPELQPLLRGLHVIAAPERAGQQAVAAPNPDQWLTTALPEFTLRYKSLLQPERMQDWPAARLDTFLYQTKEIHDDYERAEMLRNSKA